MTGGVVSTTVMVEEQEAVLPAESDTAMPMLFVPSGKTAVSDTLFSALGALAARLLVCTARPFKLQTTVMASPSGSATVAVSVALLAHSATAGAGHVNTGARFVDVGITWARTSPPGY